MGSQGAQDAARRAKASATIFTIGALAFTMAFSIILARLLGRHVSDQPMRPVVVAIAQVPAFAQLTANNLKVVTWPESSVPAGAFDDVAAVVAAPTMTLRTLLAGEPVVRQRVAPAQAAVGVANLLPPRKRAYVIRVDEALSLAGVLLPGITVDIIATMEGATETISKTILQKIQVLAVGQTFDASVQANAPTEGNDPAKAPPKDVAVGRILTLVVTPEEAEYLALVGKDATFDVAIRPAEDVAIVDTPGATKTAILKIEGAAGQAPRERERDDPPRRKKAEGPTIYKVQ